MGPALRRKSSGGIRPIPPQLAHERRNIAVAACNQLVSWELEAVADRIAAVVLDGRTVKTATAFLLTWQRRDFCGEGGP